MICIWQHIIYIVIISCKIKLNRALNVTFYYGLHMATLCVCFSFKPMLPYYKLNMVFELTTQQATKLSLKARIKQITL